jgi:hypothetical protein
MQKKKPRSFDYDVCLSFAGEDRVYVRRVANILKSKGVRVFYDEYEQVDMWGKDLYVHLNDIYQNTAKYCVLFASKHYAKKVWTNHERQSAQARAIQQHSEYILPAKFDDTQTPGLRPTIGHIDLRNISVEQFAEMIIKKTGERQQSNYFPPHPDRLFKELKLKSAKSKVIAHLRAYHFFHNLKRMSKDEIQAILPVFVNGCPVELPDNIHMQVDLLRRRTNFAPAKIFRLASGLSSLGFKVEYRAHHNHAKKNSSENGRVIVIEWHDMSVDKDVGGNATSVACAMIKCAIEDCCEECGMKRLWQLDFSQLATATTTIEEEHNR